MKRWLAVLLGLALGWTQVPAIALQALLPAPAACSHCDCGRANCCLDSAPAESSPAVPAPATHALPDSSLLFATSGAAALTAVPRLQFSLLPHAGLAPAGPAVPLHVRNCSFLI